jgi:peptide/nickel transport system substrate-binding protein
MKRRGFLASTATALALPAVVRAETRTTLKFIPRIDLAFLDPHWTTAYISRNHGYMAFDTLFGQDGDFKYSPRMLAGFTVETDGKLWNLTLRDGLLWHDGGESAGPRLRCLDPALEQA